MSDTLGITIKLDASSVKPGADASEQSLAKVEARGDSARESLNRLGKDGTTAAEKLRASVTASVNPFDSLTEAIKRENAMLEKLHGAAAKQEQDLQTLNSLASKGKISLDEYTESLKKMHAEKGKGGEEGGFRVEGANRLGGAGGELLTGLAGGALAAGAGIEVIKHVGELHDKYVELRNSALELAEGGKSVDTVLAEQTELAGTLHASLEQTIELSTVVKQRFDDMNLSGEQQARIAQSIGEAAEYSGKGLAGAADVIGRVSFAFENGLPAGRQMKDLLREFPLLAEAMRSHFGVTDKTLVDMAQHGKISIQDFAAAMQTGAGEIDERFSHVEATWGQSLGHMKDKALQFAAGGFGAESLMNWLTPGTTALKEQNEALEKWTAKLEKANEETMAAVEAVHRLAESYSDASIEGKHFSDVHAEANKILEESSGKYAAAQLKVESYKEAIQSIRRQWAEMNVIRRSHGEAAIPLKDFITGQDATVALEYLKAQQALTDASSKYSDVVTPIHQKEIEREQGIHRLKSALNDGAINQAQFNKAILEYIPISEKAKEAERARRELFAEGNLTGAGRRAAGRANESLQGFRASYLDNTNLLEDQNAPTGRSNQDLASDEVFKKYQDLAPAIEKYRLEQQQLMDLTREANSPDEIRVKLLAELKEKTFDLATPVEKLRKEMSLYDGALTRGDITLDEYKRKVGELKEKLIDVLPEEKYAKALNTLNAEAKLLSVSSEELERAQDKLAMQFHQGDIGTGFRSGMEQIKTSIDPALDAQKLLVDGFNGIRDSITELVTTGTADFGKLVDSILADAARMAEDQLLKSLFSAISSGGGSGGGLGAAAASIIGGAADGASFTIPHFANGGTLTPMRSGRDDHLLQMFVRSGERVQVQTEEQQKAAQGGVMMAPAPVVHVHNIVENSRTQLAPMRGAEGGDIVMNHIGQRRNQIRAMLGIK